jgi:hypothetical protein
MDRCLHYPVRDRTVVSKPQVKGGRKMEVRFIEVVPVKPQEFHNAPALQSPENGEKNSFGVQHLVHSVYIEGAIDKTDNRAFPPAAKFSVEGADQERPSASEGGGRTWLLLQQTENTFDARFRQGKKC